jgi:hypothetical protein
MERCYDLGRGGWPQSLRDEPDRHWRKPPDQGVLDAVAFHHILRGLARNPRIGIPHEQSVIAGYGDVGAFAYYQELASGIWEVAELAPIELD